MWCCSWSCLNIVGLSLPFALGALSAQDPFYFQFEGSWLHSEYKLVFQISMRIDSWLKFSEKAFFPHPELSSFLVWWADFFFSHLFTECVVIWEFWLFSLGSQFQIHTSYRPCLLFLPSYYPKSLSDWHCKWLRTLKYQLTFRSLFFSFLFVFAQEISLILLWGAKFCFKKMLIVFYSAFSNVF